MSNNYFQFQQFRIEQGKCAMKVSTDACIQGAWTPIESNVINVLDIGTGTGLLSLMLAQRNESTTIDAIELDENAAGQAKENVAASPWSNRIKVVQGDICTYNPAHRYDMIICNPPFFQNSLLGNRTERNMARHTLSLSYEDLLQACDRLLQQEGYASVLLPAAEHTLWEALLHKNNWHIAKRLMIVPKEGATHNRVVSLCTRAQVTVQDETLVIRAADGSYTDAFRSLLYPYYLHL